MKKLMDRNRETSKKRQTIEEFKIPGRLFGGFSSRLFVDGSIKVSVVDTY